MDFGWLSIPAQIVGIDLLLSGDNAVVVALACRSLPAAQRRPALMLGIGGAVALRLVLTGLVVLLLDMPYFKLAGAVCLMGIAIRLGRPGGADPDIARPAALWQAVMTIIAADAVMSLDNVVALAAVAQGHLLFLVLGLGLSIPILIGGSVVVLRLFDRRPWLVLAGAMLLGWIAGDTAMADAALADWVRQQAPALTLVLPALTTAYVLVDNRITAAERAAARPAAP